MEFAGDDLGPGQWNEVAGVNDENFGLGNQSGSALREGLRHSSVLGAVENQGGNREIGQHAWNVLEKHGGIPIAHHGHETPSAAQAGKRSTKLFDGIGGLRLAGLQRNTHNYIPENCAHEGGEDFAEDWNADVTEKVKRFQLRKHSRRKKHEMVDALLIGVGVVHGNGGACIVTDDVPLLDAALDADLLNLLREDGELFGTVGDFGGLAKTREIHGQTMETAAQFADDAVPKPAAGGHAVYEQNGIT